MSWIKCSDQLPDEYMDILMVSDGDVKFGFFKKGFFGIYENHHGCEYFEKYENVTHWQPLPEPPHNT